MLKGSKAIVKRQSLFSIWFIVKFIISLYCYRHDCCNIKIIKKRSKCGGTLMESFRYKKLYLMINIPLILIFFILFFTPFFINDRGTLYYTGIIDRYTIGIWCVFNGIWNSSTDFYSILKTNQIQKNKKVPKWTWWFLLILGVGFLITAYMGYGFNNVQKPR